MGDDAIRENIQYSPFTKRTDNNSEKATLNVPRVVFSCTPGGSSGGQLNASGEGYFRTGGVHMGEGAVPEGRITKAVIECQTGQAGGNIFAS